VIVLKYSVALGSLIGLGDNGTRSLPEGAVIVDVACQPGDENHVHFWVVCEMNQPMVDRRFVIVPTGMPAPANAEYVGSAHQPYTDTLEVGEFVWHLFERTD